MKILHISASYKPAYIYGGPIMSVAKLCEALTESKEQGEEGNWLKSFDSTQDDNVREDIARNDITSDDFEERPFIKAIDLEVLTTTANGKVELDVEAGESRLVDGVPVTYFKRWTKDHSHFSLGLLWGLCKMLRQAQHDKDKIITHIHAWWNLVSVLSCFVAKWYNVPLILSPRGMITNYTQNNKSSLSKRLLHNIIGFRLLKYCHIHTTSEQEKEEVLKIIQPKSITVIPNLVSLQKEGSRIKDKLTDRKSELTSSTFNLIFLSRIEQKKGLELFFEALILIDLPWTLTIAGTGDAHYIESLKLKAENLKLNTRIEWMGQISAQDKFELLAKHDLLVLTSYNENFANVVIESLSVGTPVLVSEQVGLADYVKTNKLGWTCELNAADIKEHIMSSYYDQLTREMIRNKAPQMIKNDFNDGVLVRRYLELYERILRFHSE